MASSNKAGEGGGSQRAADFHNAMLDLPGYADDSMFFVVRYLSTQKLRECDHDEFIKCFQELNKLWSEKQTAFPEGSASRYGRAQELKQQALEMIKDYPDLVRDFDRFTTNGRALMRTVGDMRSKLLSAYYQKATKLSAQYLPQSELLPVTSPGRLSPSPALAPNALLVVEGARVRIFGLTVGAPLECRGARLCDDGLQYFASADGASIGFGGSVAHDAWYVDAEHSFAHNASLTCTRREQCRSVDTHSLALGNAWCLTCEALQPHPPPHTPRPPIHQPHHKLLRLPSEPVVQLSSSPRSQPDAVVSPFFSLRPILPLLPIPLLPALAMANYYGAQQSPPYGGGGAQQPAGPSAAQNLQFYPSSYDTRAGPGISGAATPQQAGYGYGNQAGYGGAAQGFGAAGSFAGGVSGRMGEQGGLRTGWLAAFSTEGYDGEPPLLEELGVNFGHIQTKTLAVLNPFKRIDHHLMDDSDLAGPMLSFLLFGTFLLFSGKVHFGYIYGLALLGSTTLHLILSLMSPDDAAAAAQQQPAYPQYNEPQEPLPRAPQQMGHFSTTLTFPRSASVLGYCLLPLVATSLVGIVMPMDTPLGIVLTTAAIMWCTYSASAMFCAVGRMKGMRGLVAYPLALFYVGFGIMGIFSSRGSGSLANAAAKVKG
ncbi:hypothetical protein AK830_g6350 [Neonectria ditissima]|uniref:Protein YIP n=1 Tax=Neonectria ditissima TaxID=78410 RepID=A0A0P7B0N1_9HYPO|nr:hypothetical protein AK830_g6350 [Neonectria ditissima]